MSTREQDEYAREGGGAPSDRHDGHSHEATTSVETIPAVGSEASVVNRRDLPGGSFRPAHMPGALGPTTRDTEDAVSQDANPSLVGRTEIAGAIQEKPKAPSN